MHRLKAAIRALQAALVLACLALGSAALAHEGRPALLSLTLEDGVDGSGTALRLVVTLDAEERLAGSAPGHGTGVDGNEVPEATYQAFRDLAPEVLERRLGPSAAAIAENTVLRTADQRVQLSAEAIEVAPETEAGQPRQARLVYAADLVHDVTELYVKPDSSLGDVILRVAWEGEPRPFWSGLLAADSAGATVSLGATAPRAQSSTAGFGTVMLDYVAIGFEHILPKGLDHILFVVGLFLLSPYVRPLACQITGFTVAHSLTLALGIFGVLRLPPEIVEPLIAASIVFIAVENIVTDRLQRWRPAVVFGFGLVHGLGFAGVLGEVGLPPNEAVAALLGFNIGVEIAQLTVAAICFLMVGLWFRAHDWYRRWVSSPASAMLAIVGAVWFVERLA